MKTAFPACMALGILLGCGRASESESIPTWEIEPELRVGSTNDAGYALTYFAELQVGPENEIYVPQPRDVMIHVYNAAGHLARTIGRSGAGPGEFRRITRMGWKADTLWVADAELHRISLFDRTGEYLSTRRLGGAAFRNRYPLEPVALLSDGSILTSPHVTSPEVVSGELLDKPLLRITSDGASPDTVVWLSLRNSVLGIQNTEAPWRGLYSSQPFPDNPLWQLAPDGSSIIVVDRTAPATIEEATIGVSRIGLAGDTIWSRRYAFAPAILRDELRDSVVTQWVDLVLEARGPGITSQRVAERRVREAVHLPPFYPGVEGSYFATGRDGSVWLPVRQAVEPQKAYWLVNSDGRLVAQIPRTFDILYGTDQTLWGRESDELDVPYVVRYAVRDD